MQGQPYDADEVRATLERIVDDPDQLGGPRKGKGDKGDFERCMHPFYAFDVLGSLVQMTEDLATYEKGQGDRFFDILLLGGSVAAGFGNHGWVTLRDRIKADPRFERRPVRLLRYARASFKQPQQLNVLTYLLNIGIVPDAVINLDGFNEVAVSNGNAHLGVHPLQPSVSQWASRTMSAVSDPEGLEHLMQLRMLQTQVKAKASRALGSGMLWCSILGKYWLGGGQLRQAHAGRDAEPGDEGAQWRSWLPRRARPGLGRRPRPRDGAVRRELEDVVARDGRDLRAPRNPLRATSCSPPCTTRVPSPSPTTSARPARPRSPGAKPSTRVTRCCAPPVPSWRSRGCTSSMRRWCSRITPRTLYIDACHFVPDGQRIPGGEGGGGVPRDVRGVVAGGRVLGGGRAEYGPARSSCTGASAGADASRRWGWERGRWEGGW